jgi:hypothetical protein
LAGVLFRAVERLFLEIIQTFHARYFIKGTFEILIFEGIFMPSTLAQKLNLKPDVVLEVTNIPANWEDQLGRELSSNPVTFTASDKSAARMIFVKNRDQVEE